VTPFSVLTPAQPAIRFVTVVEWSEKVTAGYCVAQQCCFSAVGKGRTKNGTQPRSNGGEREVQDLRSLTSASRRPMRGLPELFETYVRVTGLKRRFYNRVKFRNVIFDRIERVVRGKRTKLGAAPPFRKYFLDISSKTQNFVLLADETREVQRVESFQLVEKT